MMVLCVGSLPLITHGQRDGQSLLQEGRRLALSTKRVDHPDGRTVDSLSGRHQKGDKTINLSAFVVKKGIKSRRGGPRSQNPASNALFSKVSMRNSPPTFLTNPQNPAPVEEGGYDPGYDYYYSYSEMARPDGTVIANASYEYQASANLNNLYVTVGGVTLTFDLTTEEAAPISDAEQQQLDAWGASEDANTVRDTSIAIIDEGAQQSPSQLLLNYYAIALFVDTVPVTASGPRLDNSRKSSLHHAASKLRTPVEPVSASCPVRMITPVVAVRTSVDFATIPAVSSHLAPQGCFGCCGPGCHCITDRYGAPIYGTPCANHDSCVGQNGGYIRSAGICAGKFAKAVVYTWWRNSSWGAAYYY
jgi:hypothetical protein